MSTASADTSSACRASLGKDGVEKVIEIDMNADEKALMDESISHVKDLVNVVTTTFPELA